MCEYMYAVYVREWYYNIATNWSNRSYTLSLRPSLAHLRGCWMTAMRSSTARAEAIMERPGLDTVHCWSSVLSRVDCEGVCVCGCVGVCMWVCVGMQMAVSQLVIDKNCFFSYLFCFSFLLNTFTHFAIQPTHFARLSPIVHVLIIIFP